MVQRLDEFNSVPVLPLIARGPGTATAQMQMRGNSMLSSLFIAEMDPGSSVKINYYDTTTGSDDGERYNLNGHALFSAPQTLLTDRITVTRIHDKPVCEYIVNGGNVTFGVYVTVVTSFANDNGAALIAAGQAESAADRGTPIAILDPSTGLYHLGSGVDGVLNVSIDNAVSTTDLLITGVQGCQTPASGLMAGSSYTLVKFTAQATIKVPTVIIGGGSRGYFELAVNGKLWGIARCTYTSPQLPFSIGTLTLNAGDNLTVTVTGTAEDGGAGSYFAFAYTGT